MVRVKLGSPVIFKQERLGKIDEKTGREKILTLYKFRTMTDEKDENGKLLPDGIRLTRFGRLLRSTSLDELPEAVKILFLTIVKDFIKKEGINSGTSATMEEFTGT